MTTTTTSAAATDLSEEHLALQRRARDFVEQVLLPLELTAEAAAGRLPEQTSEHIKREAIAARLQGGRVPVELGGQGGHRLGQLALGLGSDRQPRRALDHDG